MVLRPVLSAVTSTPASLSSPPGGPEVVEVGVGLAGASRCKRFGGLPEFGAYLCYVSVVLLALVLERYLVGPNGTLIELLGLLELVDGAARSGAA